MKKISRTTSIKFLKVRKRITVLRTSDKVPSKQRKRRRIKRRKRKRQKQMILDQQMRSKLIETKRSTRKERRKRRKIRRRKMKRRKKKLKLRRLLMIPHQGEEESERKVLENPQSSMSIWNKMYQNRMLKRR